MSTRKNQKSIKSVKSETGNTDIQQSEPVVVSEIVRNESSSDLSTESGDQPKKSRVVVTRDSVMTSFDEIIQLVEDEISNLKDSQNKTKGIKFLRTINKRIKTLKIHSSKIVKQKATKKTTPNANSGFQKPVKISKEMAKFAGWSNDELKSRVDVTKYLCNYIKENNLQNPKDRRQIISDVKLSKLLKYDSKKETEPLTYFRLQNRLKEHFPKDVAITA